MKLISLSISVSSVLLGCAGPTSPLGPVSLFSENFNKLLLANSVTNESSAKNRRISFFPSRQVLHKATSLEIKIVDTEGIPEDYKMKVFFDRREVTRHVIQHSKIEWDPEGRHWLKVKLPLIRLRSDLDGDIIVYYQRNAQTALIATEYQKPKCNLKASGNLLRIEDFEVEPKMLGFINESAQQNEINPFLIAGLIAQESGFQSNAFSFARAVGLTQVTPIGEQEILRIHSDWPRYPGLNELPIPYVKLLLQQQSLNASNEWRLNPEYSIYGGSTYLKQLESYWSRPDKNELLRSQFSNLDQNMSRVVLASYNSGASRVSQAIESNQKNWLKKGVGLDSARKYVNRVMSYCHRFSEEEYD